MLPLHYSILPFALLVTSAYADSACYQKAIDKNGHALHGAALSSFMDHCTQQQCEPLAVDKHGKPLYGAAKTSFMRKCQQTK